MVAIPYDPDDSFTRRLAERRGEQPPEPAHSTWLPIDLTDALEGRDVDPPSILARTDGVAMLYKGRTHGLAGESETCKSWAAQIGSAQQIQAGNDVLWIDFEDDERGVVSRLLAMGCSKEAITEHFVYVRPEEPLRNKQGAWTAGGVDFDKVLASRKWTLIVIDGVTEAMVTEDLDLNSNADTATWSRLLPKRCAATGAAVVMLDHVPKAIDNRGRYAIGSQHKLAGLTGAQYVFETEKPFSRAVYEPVTGVIKITVTKDRPGHVRTHSREGIIARLELTSYPDGGVTAKLLPPEQSSSPLDLILATHIAEYLRVYPSSSQTAIEKTVTGDNSRIRATLKAMVEKGWASVEQRGQAKLHTLTQDGIDAFDI